MLTPRMAWVRSLAERTPALHRSRPQALVLAGMLALTLMLALPAAPALAERVDRFQPIEVESDRMQYDDVKQVNVFSGRVVLTRGSLVLRADQLVLRQDPEGYAHASAAGQPARFRQKRDGLDEWIEGQAEELVYDAKAETMRLMRRAQIRRLEGNRLLDHIEGANILYDSRSERYTVDGSNPAAAGDGGRVRITIQPRITPEGSPKGGR
jgi:lipopolysaccharide export system protein LptA